MKFIALILIALVPTIISKRYKTKDGDDEVIIDQVGFVKDSSYSTQLVDFKIYTAESSLTISFKYNPLINSDHINIDKTISNSEHTLKIPLITTTLLDYSMEIKRPVLDKLLPKDFEIQHTDFSELIDVPPNPAITNAITKPKKTGLKLPTFFSKSKNTKKHSEHKEGNITINPTVGNIKENKIVNPSTSTRPNQMAKKISSFFNMGEKKPFQRTLATGINNNSLLTPRPSLLPKISLRNLTISRSGISITPRSPQASGRKARTVDEYEMNPLIPKSLLKSSKNNKTFDGKLNTIPEDLDELTQNLNQHQSTVQPVFDLLGSESENLGHLTSRLQPIDKPVNPQNNLIATEIQNNNSLKDLDTKLPTGTEANEKDNFETDDHTSEYTTLKIIKNPFSDFNPIENIIDENIMDLTIKLPFIYSNLLIHKDEFYLTLYSQGINEEFKILKFHNKIKLGSNEINTVKLIEQEISDIDKAIQKIETIINDFTNNYPNMAPNLKITKLEYQNQQKNEKETRKAKLSENIDKYRTTKDERSNIEKGLINLVIIKLKELTAKTKYINKIMDEILDKKISNYEEYLKSLLNQRTAIILDETYYIDKVPENIKNIGFKNTLIYLIKDFQEQIEREYFTIIKSANTPDVSTKFFDLKEFSENTYYKNLIQTDNKFKDIVRLDIQEEIYKRLEEEQEKSRFTGTTSTIPTIVVNNSK
jgi:hypothetical protein